MSTFSGSHLLLPLYWPLPILAQAHSQECHSDARDRGGLRKISGGLRFGSDALSPVQPLERHRGATAPWIPKRSGNLEGLGPKRKPYTHIMGLLKPRYINLKDILGFHRHSKVRLGLTQGIRKSNHQEAAPITPIEFSSNVNLSMLRLEQAGSEDVWTPHQISQESSFQQRTAINNLISEAKISWYLLISLISPRTSWTIYPFLLDPTPRVLGSRPWARVPSWPPSLGSSGMPSPWPRRRRCGTGWRSWGRRPASAAWWMMWMTWGWGYGGRVVLFCSKVLKVFFSGSGM